MPLYEYECGTCGYKFSELRKVDHRTLPCLCPKCCGISEKVPSIFFCITDTNFWYTGKYDSRLGSVVEGRKDWKKKIEAKGYREKPLRECEATTTTVEERIKKHNLGV